MADIPKSIPNKYRDRILHWDDERECGNSIIVSLKDGWRFPNTECHTSGFDNVKDGMTDEKAREILKKHAAAYGDSRYEPALWVIEAMKEAAEVSKTVTNQAWLAQVAIEYDADVVARRMGFPNAT